MKRIIVISIAISILSACSALTGTDGDAYIAYSWVSCKAIYTDDPSFGPTIYNEIYEDATEGTWNFEYVSFDDSYWIGTYTVYKNPGVLLYDGDDVYFMLTLYSFGPSFYEWSYPYYHSRNTQGLSAAETGTAEYVETLTKDGYTVELHAWKGVKADD